MVNFHFDLKFITFYPYTNAWGIKWRDATNIYVFDALCFVVVQGDFEDLEFCWRQPIFSHSSCIFWEFLGHISSLHECAAKQQLIQTSWHIAQRHFTVIWLVWLDQKAALLVCKCKYLYQIHVCMYNILYTVDLSRRRKPNLAFWDDRQHKMCTYEFLCIHS